MPPDGCLRPQRKAPGSEPQTLEEALGGAAGIPGWLGLAETAAENASAAGMLAARQKHRGVALELHHLPGLEHLSVRVRRGPALSCPCSCSLCSGCCGQICCSAAAGVLQHSPGAAPPAWSPPPPSPASQTLTYRS